MPVVRSTPPLVHRPVTVHDWRDVVFAHWRHDPASLAGLVPRGTRPDVVDGSAWAGVCAYLFRQTTVPPFPSAGRLGVMTEVTIEVLTVDDAGRHGIAYRTVDTSNVPAIVAAHALLGVPYTFAHARSRRRGEVVTHRSVRAPRRSSPGPLRLPSAVTVLRPGGAGRPRHDATVRVVAGDRDDGALGAALTTRVGIHARHLGQTFFWQREHPELTLRTARLERLDGDLPDAVGMPGLFDRPPDSLLVLDRTTVRYAWGDVLR